MHEMCEISLHENYHSIFIAFQYLVCGNKLIIIKSHKNSIRKIWIWHGLWVYSNISLVSHPLLMPHASLPTPGKTQNHDACSVGYSNRLEDHWGGWAIELHNFVWQKTQQLLKCNGEPSWSYWPDGQQNVLEISKFEMVSGGFTPSQVLSCCEIAFWTKHTWQTSCKWPPKMSSQGGCLQKVLAYKSHLLEVRPQGLGFWVICIWWTDPFTSTYWNTWQ